MYSMELIIDNRETSIKEYFINNNQYNDIIKYENLDLGDIVIKYDGIIKYIFERKTLKDLSDSIKDNRYHEQKQRFNLSLDSSIKINYIFENFTSYNEINNKNFHGLRGSILLSAILNTTIINNYGIFLTKNVKETIFIIEEFIKRMIKNENKYFNNNKTQDIDNKCLLKRRKKDNITKENILTLYLSQIPGISNRIGGQISDRFGSMNNLILKLNEYDNDEERINYLSEIEIEVKNNKKRKLGNKTSEKIIEVLF